MTINIDDLIKLGEGYHLEFKEGIDKSFAKEACAFANASGGKILLGVTDKGLKKNIVLDNQLSSRIQDTINHIEPRCHATVSQVDGIVCIINVNMTT
ncbi:MAG: helix-turn-helix domain-containing protein [Neisseriaceae bacterium]|jgi:ATP-dependent DNA helicase RecG